MVFPSLLISIVCVIFRLSLDAIDVNSLLSLSFFCMCGPVDLTGFLESAVFVCVLCASFILTVLCVLLCYVQ